MSFCVPTLYQIGIRVFLCAYPLPDRHPCLSVCLPFTRYASVSFCVPTLYQICIRVFLCAYPLPDMHPCLSVCPICDYHMLCTCTSYATSYATAFLPITGYQRGWGVPLYAYPLPDMPLHAYPLPNICMSVCPVLMWINQTLLPYYVPLTCGYLFLVKLRVLKISWRMLRQMKLIGEQ